MEKCGLPLGPRLVAVLTAVFLEVSYVVVDFRPCPPDIGSAGAGDGLADSILDIIYRS